MNNRILYNEEVASGHFRMGIGWKTPPVYPGQFVMLRVTGGLDPFLRRPFGVYKVLEPKGKSAQSGTGMEILYRVVGRGTRLMASLSAGDAVGVIGPFGNSFPMPKKGERAVMVAGGMGIAPMYMLAQRLGRGVLLFGARSRDEARIADDFNGLGCQVKVATEDGSAGVKGLVTALLEKELGKNPVVYACGPTAMLKAVALMCEKAGSRTFVSLERSMACGIGVCLGCAVKSGAHAAKDNRVYSMVCADGPVFPAADIDWGAL